MLVSFYKDNITSKMQQSECPSTQLVNSEKVGREEYSWCEDNVCSALQLKGAAVVATSSNLYFFCLFVFQVCNDAVVTIHKSTIMCSALFTAN